MVYKFRGGGAPVKFRFDENVTIDIRNENNNTWNGYGVWIRNSANSSVDLTFNKGLSVTLENTTNRGIGLVCDSNDADGNNNGSVLRVGGPSSITVKGRSVIGAVAGSMFNNNSRPGGKLIFGPNQLHEIDVTSDWSDRTNSDSHMDWAVGLLSYENGGVDIKGDMTLNLHIKNMRKTTRPSSEGAGPLGNYTDPAAGIYVDGGSYLNTENGTVLNILVSGEGSSKTLPYVYGIYAGLGVFDPRHREELSSVTLDGTTNIYMEAGSKTSKFIGLSAAANSQVNAKGMVHIRSSLSDEISFTDYLQYVYVYGVSAGTMFPDLYAYIGGASNNQKSGYAYFGNGLIIEVPRGRNPALQNFVAIHSNGCNHDNFDGGVKVDNTSPNAGIVKIEGQIKTENDGRIELNLSGSESFISGSIESSKEDPDDWQNILPDGSVIVNLSKGATWNVLDNLALEKNFWLNSNASYLKKLSLSSGGTLNISRPDVYSRFFQQSDYQLVRIWDSLTGEGGHMVFDIDLVGENDVNKFTDQLQVDKAASGVHSVDINFIGGVSAVDPEKKHSVNWLVSQGSGSSLTLQNSRGGNGFSGRGMVTVWSLKFLPDSAPTGALDDEEYRKQMKNYGEEPGKWYLIRTEVSIPDPEPNPGPAPDQPPIVTPPLPPEVTENINMGTSSGQALAYLADLEDLRKRLGEVRYGAQDGGWVKVFTKKDSVNASGTAGFKQETSGLNIGFDRLVNADEDQAWLLGGAFRYGKADQDGIGVKSSTGKLYEYSFKSYATWMSDNGSYADLVAQIGRYEQKLDGFDNTGKGSSHASYNTVGYGLSAELGHMLSFGESVDDRRWYNHFYVEPQIQLSYFHVKGQDYTTSTGLAVSQGDADFLTGRAGVVLGKKFNYGTIDDLDRRYFQVGLLGGVKHEFLGGDQTISYTGIDGGKASVYAGDIDGTRFYYGVNCDWQVTENFRLYAQASREEGDRYTKDYDISIGGKLLF